MTKLVKCKQCPIVHICIGECLNSPEMVWNRNGETMKQASEHIPDWATDIYLDLPLMESVANTIARNSDGSWHDAEEVVCMQAQLVAEHLYGKDDDINEQLVD